MDSEKLKMLLTNNSTLKYHVNYEKYYFNHLSQGLIAIHNLGGTEADLIKFMDWYTKDLFKADKYKALEDVTKFKDLDEVEMSNALKNMRGQKKYFYFLVSHFEKLLEDKYKGDLEDLVVNEYVNNQLYAGLLGSALHSLIQIGYGLSINHPRIVCEGLAYAVTVHFGLSGDQPLDKIGCGKKDIFVVLKDLKSDDELNAYLKEESDKRQDDIVEKSRLVTLIEVLYGTRQADLLKYAEEVGIQFPEENQESCLNSFFDSITRVAIALFARSETLCDFFFLHGITSAWALKQIVLRVSNYISLSEVHKMVKVFICALLAVYLARNTPELKSLSEVQHDLQIRERSWSEIIRDALAEERDEHVYKLVMTCWKTDVSNNLDNEGGVNACKLASEIALKYDLFI